MKDGVIQQIDTPMTIYNARQPIRAGFIGSPAMNFIPYRVLPRDGVRRLDGGSFRVPVPEGRFAGNSLPTAGGDPGDSPNDVHERNAAPERLAQAPFRAEIEVVEPLGSEIYITVAAGGQGLIARVPAETSVRSLRQIEGSSSIGRGSTSSPRNRP